MWLRNRKQRRFMHKAGLSSQIASALRHPLTALVVGFVLTAVVGRYISGYADGLNEERRAQKQREENALKLSAVIVNQILMARELADAIRRDASSSELETKIEKYGKSVEAWHEQLLLLPLTIKTLTTSPGWNIYYGARVSVDTAMRVMDRCLRKSVSEKNHISAVAVLDQCPAPTWEELTPALSPNDAKRASARLRKEGQTFEKQMERAVVCATEFGRGVARDAGSKGDQESLEGNACDLAMNPGLSAIHFWQETEEHDDFWRAPQILIDLAAEPWEHESEKKSKATCALSNPNCIEGDDTKVEVNADYFDWGMVMERLYHHWSPIFDAMPFVGP
jgi:hypothetical protein